jgi:hypothetical protein
MKKSLITTFVVASLFTGLVTPAFADTTFDFGTCVNPQVAASQVNYGNSHGVVGKAPRYSGVDKIYTLENGNVMQCLCPDEGKGIQTNWLKAEGYSEKDINVLKKQGWTYVATGSSWGLSDVPYMAKNIEYSCREESKVLAATGVSVAIYGLILAGVVSLLAGLLLKRFSK